MLVRARNKRVDLIMLAIMWFDDEGALWNYYYVKFERIRDYNREGGCRVFFVKVDNERIYIRIESRFSFGNGTAHFAISE